MRTDSSEVLRGGSSQGREQSGEGAVRGGSTEPNEDRDPVDETCWIRNEMAKITC